MKKISVPESEPQIDPVEFSTEVAFTSLVTEAKKLGMDLAPAMGLMYLPTEKLAEDFKEACQNILAALVQEMKAAQQQQGASGPS